MVWRSRSNGGHTRVTWGILSDAGRSQALKPSSVQHLPTTTSRGDTFLIVSHLSYFGILLTLCQRGYLVWGMKRLRQWPKMTGILGISGTIWGKCLICRELSWRYSENLEIAPVTVFMPSNEYACHNEGALTETIMLGLTLASMLGGIKSRIN